MHDELNVWRTRVLMQDCEPMKAKDIGLRRDLSANRSGAALPLRPLHFAQAVAAEDGDLQRFGQG
ncbi:MAG: hypothetical protein ACREQ4_13425 [Candidatus Binataceae bacterium]